VNGTDCSVGGSVRRLQTAVGVQPPLTPGEPPGGDGLPPITPLGGERIQRLALIVVVILAFLAAAWVTSPLWAGLLLGLLTAFTIEPWYQRVLGHFPRRPGLLAAAAVTVVALGCAAVVAGLSAIVTRELLDAVAVAQEFVRDFSFDTIVSPSVTRRLTRLGITPALIEARLASIVDHATAAASRIAGAAVGSTLSILGGALIALITAYYMLKDSRPIERRLAEILPLHPQITRELLADFRKVGRGTLIGSVFAALIQGGFAAVGYALGGVSRAALLGVVTAVASFIPVLGTMLVWIPVGIVLLVQGRVAAGIFELAWGVLLTTSLVDYVIRPVVVGRGSRSHPLVFLVGVIGGLEVFGGVGVFAGPIVMAFFVSVLRIYRRDVVQRAHEAAR
jgi:predicted PurR-regulated permease PerM